MYQYRQIIVQLRLGEKDRAIARTGIASRKKVKAIRKIAKAQGWLASEYTIPEDAELAKFFTRSPATLPKGSLVVPHQKQIETWHQQGVQASTIYGALKRTHGFTGSYFSVQRFVKKLKAQTPAVSTILEFEPGEAAQVDFGAGPKFMDEDTGEIVSTWIFVMVLCWSRHMYAEIVLHQDIPTWLGCHRRAFEWFGGVPKKIIIDNAKCAITKACYYDPTAQRAYADYAEGYGFIISACPPHDPQKKGRVESGVKYVKNAFVPLREFRGIVDSNQQLKAWLLGEAGHRTHGSTFEKPLTLFEETERHLLKPLPENPPECAVWAKATLHGDCHVMYLKCRYSAPYRLVRQILWLRATETTVRIFHEHTLVAIHPHLFKLGSKNTLDEHLPPNALAYKMQDAQWCLEQAEKVGDDCKQVIHHLLTHSVVDYLRAAQGIVNLRKKYGNVRLNAACRRALSFQSVSYRTIKTMLETGAEIAALPVQEAFDTLVEAYTGKGRYSRDLSTLLQ